MARDQLRADRRAFSGCLYGCFALHSGSGTSDTSQVRRGKEGVSRAEQMLWQAQPLHPSRLCCCKDRAMASHLESLRIAFMADETADCRTGSAHFCITFISLHLQVHRLNLYLKLRTLEKTCLRFKLQKKCLYFKLHLVIL